MDLSSEFTQWFLGGDNPFRKSITYTPSGAAAKTIYGIVTTRGTAKIGGQGKLNSGYDIELIISHDATNGIYTVTPNKDTVSFSAPEYGNVTNTYMVGGIINYSPMMWHLGLRP